MSSILINLGFFQIKWYSFLIMIGVIVAYLVTSKESKKKDLKNDELLDILFYGLLIGILGARLYFVLFNIEYYSSHLLEIIQVWKGGLAIHGGIIATFIFLLIYTNKKKEKLFLLTDIMVPGVIIAQAIGRWGNFFNQEAFGRAVSKESLQFLPKFIVDGMYINGLYREPTFLYESIWNIIGFIGLLLLRKNKKIKTGMLTGIYFVWYGLGRYFIEFLRSDSLMLGSIKVAQLVSILGIILGMILIIKSNKNNKLYKEDTIGKK